MAEQSEECYVQAYTPDESYLGSKHSNTVREVADKARRDNYKPSFAFLESVLQQENTGARTWGGRAYQSTRVISGISLRTFIELCIDGSFINCEIFKIFKTDIYKPKLPTRSIRIYSY
jgi:hypothetical protein